MEGDDDEASALRQHPLGGGQRVGEFVEFAIDEDAERLERPGRRMNLAEFLPPDGARHDLGQFARRRDCVVRPSPHDRRDHQPRLPLLAEHRDHPGKVARLHAVDDIAGGRPVVPHPHVERPVLAKGKAALGLVDLHRRDADIEHDAVDGFMAVIGGKTVEVGEVCLRRA